MAVNRDEAVSLTQAFLERNGCRVVDSVELLRWTETERLVGFHECHFVTLDRPLWSVLFKDQLHPELSYQHPEGPIVLVDAVTGVAEFFAAM